MHDDTDIIPIDDQVLKNIFGDKPDVFKEILNDFIAPTQQIIRDIKTGWENHVAVEVEQAAHKLKSSAKSVGANTLGDVCVKLEAAGRHEDWNVIDQYVPKLDAEMKEVEAYIESL